MNRYSSLLIVTVLLVLISCSSQYHWVKVKSADPNLIKKEDVRYVQIPNNTLNNGNQAIAPESGTSVKNSEEPILTLKSLRGIDHGSNSVARTAVVNKAREIEKTLSAERKEALASKDIAIRTQAIKETLHEQFSKVGGFNKLSGRIQDKLENALSKKLVKRDLKDGPKRSSTPLFLGIIFIVSALLLAALFPSSLLSGDGLAFLLSVLLIVGIILLIVGLVRLV